MLLLACSMSERYRYEMVRNQVWKRALKESASGIISGPQVQALGGLLCSTFTKHPQSWHCHELAPPRFHHSPILTCAVSP